MTYQEWATVEKSLSGLTLLDKLELVERLVQELRSAAAMDLQISARLTQPLTETEFKRHLLKSGMMSSLPVPPEHEARPKFEPVALEGEPLSETIIRDRL